MSPELDSRVARMEERMDSFKSSQTELKSILGEMREENKMLPAILGRAIRKAIKRCRANPPETVCLAAKPNAPQPQEASSPELSTAWNKALATLLLVIATVATLWLNQHLGGIKDASHQQGQPQIPAPAGGK